MISQYRKQVVLGNKSELDKQPDQGGLLFLLEFHDALHLVAREEAPFNQLLCKIQMGTP
jgi:hypothetical protein